MRLHRNLVLAVIRVLDGVFNQDLYADKTIEKILKQDKRWGSRDRGFIAETSYEIVRWKRLYLKIAEVKKPFDHQNLWRVFSVWSILKGIDLPDWKEFKETPKRRIKSIETLPACKACLKQLQNSKRVRFGKTSPIIRPCYP